MRILWYKNLYVGEKAKKKQRKIQWKLQHGAGMVGIYVITMPSNEQNSLDIIRAAYLKQAVYRRRELRIVGLAASYEEALQVLETMVQEIYANTHTLDIRSYLTSGNNFEKWQG